MCVLAAPLSEQPYLYSTGDYAVHGGTLTVEVSLCYRITVASALLDPFALARLKHRSSREYLAAYFLSVSHRARSLVSLLVHRRKTA